MFNSVTANAVVSALDGLAARQIAVANNIANVNTPGYTAQRVAFEDALRASVAKGSGRVEHSTARSLEPTQLNGNNVSLNTETLSAVDTLLRYQFATNAAGAEARALRAAFNRN